LRGLRPRCSLDGGGKEAKEDTRVIVFFVSRRRRERSGTQQHAAQCLSVVKTKEKKNEVVLHQ